MRSLSSMSDPKNQHFQVSDASDLDAELRAEALRPVSDGALRISRLTGVRLGRIRLVGIAQRQRLNPNRGEGFYRPVAVFAVQGLRRSSDGRLLNETYFSAEGHKGHDIKMYGLRWTLTQDGKRAQRPSLQDHSVDLHGVESILGWHSKSGVSLDVPYRESYSGSGILRALQKDLIRDDKRDAWPANKRLSRVP